MLSAALVLVGFGLAGCSRTPKYAPGCYLNSAVRAETRRDLEIAAGRFIGLIRTGSFETAYQEAAEGLRTRVPKPVIAENWTSIVNQITIPEPLHTEEIALAVFPEGTRGPQKLECPDPADPTGGRRMMATDQPFQAYLIQSGRVGPIVYNYASVWFFEEGRWKLSTFGAKPRSAEGHDWRHWYARARAELAAGRPRNAALLYNLTMDLLVPAPWVRPDQLDSLISEQREIRADDLPFGGALLWKHQTGVEFRPYLGAVEISGDGIVFVLSYEVPAEADPGTVAREAPLLADFIRTMFPEYREVFRDVALVATTRGDHNHVWSGVFPLTAPR